MSVAQASKSTINDESGGARRVRDVRTFQRYTGAVIMLIPATTVALGRLFQTDDSDTRRSLDLIAANPDRQFTFALLGFIGLFCIVPAFLAAGALSRRRRPVLTTVALAVNLVAYLGAFAMAAIDNLLLIGASLPPGQRDVAAIVIDKMWSAGIPGVSTSLFVLGHILGAILMGLALRGSIATVGWAMLLTTPVHVVAFTVLQMPPLDMAAWLLMTLAFACCAAKIIKTPPTSGTCPHRATLRGQELPSGSPRRHPRSRCGALGPTSAPWIWIASDEPPRKAGSVFRAGPPDGSSDRVPSPQPVDPSERRGRLRCGSGYRAIPWRPPLPGRRPSRSDRSG